MGQKGLVLVCSLFAFLASARLMPGQNFEASGNGGFGVADGDGYGKSRAPSGGVTLGWPYTSAHKLQFDYTFAHLERRFINYNRHFFTGSYVIQPRQGRTRPFLQFGAGIQYETNNATQVVGRDFPSHDFRTVFAGVVGAGVTIELGHSAFIRPQVRTYLAPGDHRTVNVTALPSVGVGVRF
jgi:hypothetical protein